MQIFIQIPTQLKTLRGELSINGFVILQFAISSTHDLKKEDLEASQELKKCEQRIQERGSQGGNEFKDEQVPNLRAKILKDAYLSSTNR